MVIAVQVRNLTKEYGRKLILNNVSFDVEQGEIFGIIGMSGSGKTTLLNHLIGFIEADEGEVKYHSSRVFKEKTHKELRGLHKNLQDVKRMFGFAPQAPSFYPRLTVKENLLHFGALHKVESKVIQKNMEHLLALTQLEEHQNKLGEHLSGGQQRRLSIMCGLIHKPEVLILDEPTADLDPVLRDETWRLIRAINKLGTTVIVASHLLEELEKACDRVAIIDDGKLIQYGSIQDIEEKFSHHTIEIRIDTTPENIKLIQDHVRKQNISKIKKEEGRVRIYTKKPRDTLYEVARLIRSGKVRVHSLEVHRPHLREVFSEITHK